MLLSEIAAAVPPRRRIVHLSNTSYSRVRCTVVLQQQRIHLRTLETSATTQIASPPVFSLILSHVDRSISSFLSASTTCACRLERYVYRWNVQRDRAEAFGRKHVLALHETIKKAYKIKTRVFSGPYRETRAHTRPP